MCSVYFRILRCVRSHIFWTCKEKEGSEVGGDFLEFYGAYVRTSSERKSEGGRMREGAGRERAGGNLLKERGGKE